MQNYRAAPELRSPLSHMQALRRQAVCVSAAVAGALVLSLCALLYALAEGPIALS